VKKAVAAIILAVMLAASVVAVAGCGSSSSSGKLSEPEKVFDNAMHEAVKGNFQPFLNMIPSELKDQYSQVLDKGFPYKDAKIDEIHYKTEQGADQDHVTVYYWGSFTMADGSNQTIDEVNAPAMKLVKQDGQWYFDFQGMAQQQQQPAGQG
jgi:hypothetical protein